MKQPTTSQSSSARPVYSGDRQCKLQHLEQLLLLLLTAPTTAAGNYYSVLQGSAAACLLLAAFKQRKVSPATQPQRLHYVSTSARQPASQKSVTIHSTSTASTRIQDVSLAIQSPPRKQEKELVRQFVWIVLFCSVGGLLLLKSLPPPTTEHCHHCHHQLT